MTAAALRARLHAASGDSAVVRAVAGLLTAIASLLRPWRTPVLAYDENAWFVTEVAGTAIGRTVHAASDACGRAWNNSRANAIVRAIATHAHRLTAVERIRAIGLWLLTAAITDAALTPFDPRPASLVRWTMWAAVVLLGAVAVIWPHSTHIAWIEWRDRRRGRQKA